jgi:hypothetical protein
MKKHELLTQEGNLRRKNKLRSGYSLEIIRALPAHVDIERVHVSDNHLKGRSSAQGLVEIKVRTFAEAIELTHLPELTPAVVVKVTMEREEQAFIPTTSFYPRGNVPGAWLDRHTIFPIYPIMFQMIPAPGGTCNPLVYLEWYVRVREGLYMNVRVFVEQHYCSYAITNAVRLNMWGAFGYPRGEVRTLNTLSSTKPFVTVYWDETYFNEEFTLADLLAEEVKPNVK